MTKERILMNRSVLTALVGALALAHVAGCDDPAKGKAKAVTQEPTAASVTPKQAAAEPAAAAAVAKYSFDGTSSKVEWTGSKVTGKHDGGFRTFSGEVVYSATALEASRVTVDITTDSMFSDSEKLTGHLKTADFFDVQKFPKATFASTAVKLGGEKGATHTITGNLTLHGVTKTVTFPATIKPSGKEMAVDAEFSINRKDFGLQYAGKPDDLIRDDVVIKLTIRAQNKA
jgi:polyisoprenoid-binding protein YceI